MTLIAGDQRRKDCGAASYGAAGGASPGYRVPIKGDRAAGRRSSSIGARGLATPLRVDCAGCGAAADEVADSKAMAVKMANAEAEAALVQARVELAELVAAQATLHTTQWA